MPDTTAPFAYSNLSAYTLAVEPNSTYLVCTKGTPNISDSMSGSTMWLLMVLSTFQYQPSYFGSNYTMAMTQASKAAYAESGGQATQDKVVSVTTRDGTDLAHSLGVTDLEMGVIGGAYKTARTRKIDVKGPKVFNIETHITATENSCSLGLKLGW